MSSSRQPQEPHDNAHLPHAQPTEEQLYEAEQLDDVPELSGPPPQLPEPLFESTEFSLDSILNAASSEPVTTSKVHKRASNVLKLAEENDKLTAELKAMSDRLEAAERKQKELLARQDARTR